MRRILTSALLVLLAASARADNLGEMRAELAQLSGRTAIKATYQVRRSGKSEGRFANDNFTGVVDVNLEFDTAGLRIAFPQALLDVIGTEQMTKLRDAKKDTPTLNALWEISPVSAYAALNFAPTLLRMIEGAKVAGDRPTMVQGRPAHLLILDLRPPTQQSGLIEIGNVTIEKDRLTLWLSDDGLPISAEHVRTMKGSFLMFKAQSQETEQWTFGKEHDHLLRLRYETSVNASGLGQKGVESTVFTLTPHQ